MKWKSFGTSAVLVAFVGWCEQAASEDARNKACLDLQEKCSRQAERVFHQQGYGANGDTTRVKGDSKGDYDVTATYESH